MTDILLDMERFEWFRCPDGYRLMPPSLERKGVSHEPQGIVPNSIVPNSDENLSYRPFAQTDTLYIAFAKLKTSDDLLGFMNRFGPLNLTFHQEYAIQESLRWAGCFRELIQAGQRGPGKVWSTFRLLRTSELLRNAIFVGEFHEGPTLDGLLRSEFGFPLTIASIDLVADRTKGLRIAIGPKDLISALWVQLGQKLSQGAPPRSCRYCGKIFEAGPGTSKRADAKFCCSEHSVRFHSLKRSKGG